VDVQRAIHAYDETFTGIKKYSRVLQENAQYGSREVVTPTGRHLPLDRDRLYAATNYMVQSTARDIMAQAVVNLFDSGLGDYLLLPIHDEILAQAPVRQAEEIVAEISKVMQGQGFQGLPMDTDGEVIGSSWGNAYE
jgi:DNA polymerase-1